MIFYQTVNLFHPDSCKHGRVSSQVPSLTPPPIIQVLKLPHPLGPNGLQNDDPKRSRSINCPRLHRQPVRRGVEELVTVTE